MTLRPSSIGFCVLQSCNHQLGSVFQWKHAIPRGSWARPATLLAPRPGWQTHNRWFPPAFVPTLGEILDLRLDHTMNPKAAWPLEVLRLSHVLL